ncbi:MAG: hypothetical protein B0D92_05380 [Spirochaeta sp. LUC14_002_19_P3]|nr:MAG: hypothetical protein B0D92_05380 [Spirochaeta sp. LUC14_002_19_P3]
MNHLNFGSLLARRQSRTASSIVCLAIFLLTSSLSWAESVRFGAEEGWKRVITSSLREVSSWKGYKALTLAPPGRDPFSSSEDTSAIDLLLLAEPEGLRNPAVRYRLEGQYSIVETVSARGSASIRPGKGGILLYPSPGALWSAGREWNDFTIDFFLRPSVLLDGEVFFSWEGRDEFGKPQSVTARLEKRRLVWHFTRFFRLDIDRALTLTLSSSPLVPDEWQHHRIRYKRDAFPPTPDGASPGFLEYLVDGKPVDALHTTQNGREGGDIFAPRIGKLSDQPIRLAPQFSGYIDEFRLSTAALSRFSIAHYTDQEKTISGYARTEAINTGSPNAWLREIKVRMDTPNLSRIDFYARSFATQEESWTAGPPNPENPAWIKIPLKRETEDPLGHGLWYAGKPESLVKGQFIMAGFILHPDSDADNAPLISLLDMEYELRPQL